MFLELTEILRCPRDHQEAYVVAVPVAMDGRRVVRGVIGCPECTAEFPIVDGVVYFGARGEGRGRAGLRPSGGAPPGAPSGLTARPPSPEYDVSGLTAFLSLGGPGGYAVLVGAAARFGAEIVAAVPGVHFVGVNAPAGVEPLPALSLLQAPSGLPLKSSSVRGVVLGADHAAEPWLSEAVRILLIGLRLVVESDRASPAGVAELARGAGILVGEKRSR